MLKMNHQILNEQSPRELSMAEKLCDYDKVVLENYKLQKQCKLKEQYISLGKPWICIEDSQLIEKQICDYDRIVLENKILKEKSLSAIELNEAMLPKSYLRISERFPHLTMKEIIEFDKKVRENGGSIKAHGGVYQYFKLSDSISREGWSCCINITDKIGYDRNPCKICKNPVVFYLNPLDLQDIKGIKVSDVSTVISSNIILLESAIQEYSIKIDKLKELQTTLDCLV